MCKVVDYQTGQVMSDDMANDRATALMMVMYHNGVDGISSVPVEYTWQHHSSFGMVWR